jgi:hypothetical protein
MKQNIRTGGQAFHVVLKYLSRSLPAYNPAELIRGYFIKRRRNRYGPPRYFLLEKMRWRGLVINLKVWQSFCPVIVMIRIRSDYQSVEQRKKNS